MCSLIDTHVHLSDFKKTEEIIKKIVDISQYALCVSNSPEEYVSLLKRKYQNKYVKLAIGFHPQYSIIMKFNSLLFLKNISTTKYIGEVGLDFSKKYIGKKIEQKKIFEFICDVASRNNKLLCIHCVQAEEDLFDILEKTNVTHAIIHWYSGKIEDVFNFINQGYYFSINSKMIKTKKFNELIRIIPQNKVLVESDAPFTIKAEEQYFKAMNLTYDELEKYGITCKMIYNNYRNLLNGVNNICD